MAKFYCIYMAYSKYEVMPNEEAAKPEIPTYPPDIAIVKAYQTQQQQLDSYANTPCAASQLFEADSIEEINGIFEDFKKKFQDQEWLDKNVEPYI